MIASHDSSANGNASAAYEAAASRRAKSCLRRIRGLGQRLGAQADQRLLAGLRTGRKSGDLYQAMREKQQATYDTQRRQ
jgi:hypothetical protein